MKKQFVLYLFAVIFCGMFVGCSEDDSDPLLDQAKDITIKIDDTHSFKMENFVASFEEIIFSEEKPFYNFKHIYENDKVITSTINFIPFGTIGQNVGSYNHYFDEKGIITSTDCEVIFFDKLDKSTLFYEYDEDGFIVGMTRKLTGKVLEQFSYEYNSDNKITKKVYYSINGETAQVIEYNYKETGALQSYEYDGNMNSYTYQNGQVIKEQHQSASGITMEYYNYDTNGRLQQMTVGQTEFAYSFEYMNDKRLIASLYNGDILLRKLEFGMKCNLIQDYHYFYNEDWLKSFIRTKYDFEKKPTSRYYYNGSMDRPSIKHYSDIGYTFTGPNSYAVSDTLFSAEDDEKLLIGKYKLSLDHGSWVESDREWHSLDKGEITDPKVIEKLNNMSQYTH